MDAFLIILTGSLVAICCAILGCFLILRRMAMVSDAISHAVLPGIVVVFLLGSEMDSLWMLAGAGLVGIFTTFLIEFFHRQGKLQTDAAIGVTFTWLFAIGVILVSYFANDAHIDQDCVLYGEIAYVPIDLIITESGTILGPRALIVISVVLVVIVLVIVPFFRQFLITSFDPAYATAIGMSVMVWHYALMALVSITTVAAFESVGAILVVAFLVVPPATAYLLSERLVPMILWSALFGVSASALGYFLAYAIDASIAGAMATVAGAQFAIVFGIVRWQTYQRRQATLAPEAASPAS